MKAAIDFGISNTDIAILNNGDLSFYSLPSTRKKLNCSSIKEIFSYLNISIADINLIGVTGGKSSDLNDLMDEIKIIKINEIDAIGSRGKKTYMASGKSLPLLLVLAQELPVFMFKAIILII